MQDRLRIEITSVIDKLDGSAAITFDISQDMLVALAKIGLAKVLQDAAESVDAE